MKQETGKISVPQTRRRLSIRLKAGGHSFSPELLPRTAFEEENEVVFTVITHKCTLVPTEAFEPSLAEKYLAVAGLACSSREKAVWKTQNGITAVIAIDRKCAEHIETAFGGRASYDTPLLADYATDERLLHICTESGTAYLKFYDGGRLLMAEAVPASSEEEVLYYTAKAAERLGEQHFAISVSGPQAKMTAKLLRKHFNDVQCE